VASLNECFTEEEVTQAIKSMKRKKAANMLGFTAELFQAGMRELAPVLTGLFNKMWSSGEFPSEWNEGVPVPVFKKGDAKKCTNYMTITIGLALKKLYAIVVQRGV
jgi:hypothetical protein